ncbi:helix-turn-helix transcriptional regulator [Gorillibacterium sp. sgz5001074]|uniref:helix-turn-helix transcriptional regulator n=1 Tax=Gorillibacterium sp. sgz5001074 TaxID=3446695 RepID=UPI003F67531E
MNSLENLPLYLRAKDVMEILPLKKSKIYELMNDPRAGCIQVTPKIKLWPKERFIAYLDLLDNQSA